MSCSKENVIQEAVEEFTSILQSTLPLERFSQFYDGPHLDKVAKQKSKEVWMNVQANSELDVNETMTIGGEIYPKFQEIVDQWKAKNKENKAQCDQYLQNQVDFLVSEFRTSVMIKLVSAPDVGLKELETFLEHRKNVLIDIFGKLSKPGEPLSSVHKETRLIESLECVKMETLEKQRLHLEQKANNMAETVLEDAKGTIMNIAMQLKSDLKVYQGKNPKDLVKGKLVEINYFLSLKGSPLEKYHPQIYSAILRTTAEVRKCMSEKDYEDMSAEEFAETLHEQLLFDFAREHHMQGDSFETDLASFSSIDESACEVLVENERPDVLTTHEVNETETQESKQNELQLDFAEEGVKKEKEDARHLDQDRSVSEINSTKSVAEAAVIPSEDIEEVMEVTEDFLESGSENRNKSKRLIFKSTRSSCVSISRRRSARLRRSRKLVAANPSGKKRQRIVGKLPKPSGVDSDDSTTDDSDDEEMNLSPLPSKRTQTSSSKPTESKLRQVGKRPLSDGKGKPSAEKITYLHLQKGIPLYRCNVCKRKCPQNTLRYHGENCGKSDDPLACKECGKSFIWKWCLDRHSRVHTGDRPFKCWKCLETFSQKNHLTNHFRLHAQTARFHCEACKLSFVSQHRLHDHNNTVHKERLPFGCRHCDDRFALMVHLKRHVITHADVRPFRCPTCLNTVSSKFNLISHIQRLHSQSKQAAEKLANEAAVAYLVKETNDETYRHMPERKINSLVISHVIKKANLKLPKGRATTHTRKHTGHS